MNPPPGSEGALALGCICPRMDNAYGRGWMGGVKNDAGETVYVQTVGCPVHDRRDNAQHKEG